MIGIYLHVYVLQTLITYHSRSVVLKKKVLKWVYKRTDKLFLLAIFEGCAGPLPFTLRCVVLDLLQVPNTLQYRFKIFSIATLKNARQNGVCFFLNTCRSLGIKHSSKMWLINNSFCKIIADCSKTQRRRKKWDTVLKILLIRIYWIEKQTEKLIL